MDEYGDRIATAKNRVFETKDGPAVGKNNPIRLATKDTSVYRNTGMNQIKDILICGYIRPKEGRLKGGHVNEVFWSRGSDKLFYFSPDNIILEVPEMTVKNGQIGALSINDLIGIWIFNSENNQFENKLDFYLKVYNDTHNDTNSHKK